MKIEEFLERLQGVESDGKGGYMACCPAHDDSNPSMHVNVGDDGRILVKCFSGCTAAEIVGALRLKLSDLMPDKKGKATKRKTAAKKTKAAAKKTASVEPSFKAPKKRDFGKAVCNYEYQDETGPGAPAGYGQRQEDVRPGTSGSGQQVRLELRDEPRRR